MTSPWIPGSALELSFAVELELRLGITPRFGWPEIVDLMMWSYDQGREHQAELM